MYTLVLKAKYICAKITSRNRSIQRVNPTLIIIKKFINKNNTFVDKQYNQISVRLS